MDTDLFDLNQRRDMYYFNAANEKVKKMDWKLTTDRAFNWYFNAIRKGESYDTAADCFCREVEEQIDAAELDWATNWKAEITLEPLQIMVDHLAARLKGLNQEQGYEVGTNFYGMFFSFFGDIIYDRAQEGGDDFKPIQAYWNDTLWAELPTSD